MTDAVLAPKATAEVLLLNAELLVPYWKNRNR